MSYWQILGIDNTIDLKAIKQAYARKLKVTKPDENPEGFKNLHAAYKQACQYARRHASVQPQDMAQPVESLAIIETEVASERAINQQEYAQDDSFQLLLDAPDESPIEQTFSHSHQDDAFQQELQDIAAADLEQEYAFLRQQWHEITSSVDEVTANDKSMNHIDSWQFLNDREALLDLQFKSEISHYIFARLADRLSQMQPKLVISRSVFILLDNLFLWSDRSDLLEEEFGHDVVDNVMQAVLAIDERKIAWVSPKQHKGEMIPGNYFARIFATFLDWLLLGFIAVLLSKLGLHILSSNNDGKILDFIAGMVFYMALAPLMEASPLQGTPGKILFGIKVVSKKGRRLNILHALLRSIVFTLVIAAFKVTIWINIFIKDHRLLHDRFSYSMVIKR